jgi:hypothetical protein
MALINHLEFVFAKQNKSREVRNLYFNITKKTNLKERCTHAESQT